MLPESNCKTLSIMSWNTQAKLLAVFLVAFLGGHSYFGYCASSEDSGKSTGWKKTELP